MDEPNPDWFERRTAVVILGLGVGAALLFVSAFEHFGTWTPSRAGSAGEWFSGIAGFAVLAWTVGEPSRQRKALKEQQQFDSQEAALQRKFEEAAATTQREFEQHIRDEQRATDSAAAEALQRFERESASRDRHLAAAERAVRAVLKSQLRPGQPLLHDFRVTARELHDELELERRLVGDDGLSERMRTTQAFLLRLSKTFVKDDHLALEEQFGQLVSKVVESCNESLFARLQERSLPEWRWQGGAEDDRYVWPDTAEQVAAFVKYTVLLPEH